MTPERWKQVDELLSEALELELDKRAAFLEEACAGDDALKKEVETLLSSDGQADSFIVAPTSQMAAELLSEPPAKLFPGEAIGPYKILSLLGAGGMGEVYRAQDPRIGRVVAIKILPPRFSQDPDRIRRFEQEARAAGLLNHPNILAIYDAGTENGSPYLVSELLDGQLLRQKLKGNPLPVRKAVEYSLQIAKGLQAAHEKGIVHRDLKPENIFITKEGLVKILDFGLAKLTQAETSTKPFNAQEGTEQQTDTGVVVGTVVYMSPEQVRGFRVDHRSDIFAFGAVLYEMLTGKRPFYGDSQVDVMHAILRTDPPEISRINPANPPGLERIVQRCLDKAPDHRFQSMSDLAFALESLSSASGTSAAVTKIKTPVPYAWIASAFFCVAALILALLLFRTRQAEPRQSPSEVQRLSIPLPVNHLFNSIAISPDGKYVAYAPIDQRGWSSIWVRPLDSTEPQEIPGTDYAILPFWSPNSRSIGFFARGELKTVTLGGGPPRTLCRVETVPKGGTWNQDDVILFAPSHVGQIYRIPANGGDATQATTFDKSRGDVSHRFPQFLPDGRHFSYLVHAISGENGGNGGLFLGSLDSKEQKRLLPDYQNFEYAAPGYGLFVHNGKLVAQPFDPVALAFRGEVVPIADQVESEDQTGTGLFSVSRNNIIVYLDSEGGWSFQPAWFDRSGKKIDQSKNNLSFFDKPGNYQFSDLSPDKKSLLIDQSNASWMVNLLNGLASRFAITNDAPTIFSPDGNHMTYLESAEDGTNVYQRLASGVGKSEVLFHVGKDINDPVWSADGRFMLVSTFDAATRFDEWALPMSGDRKPFPYLNTGANEEYAQFSPNSKWVAYVSDETGTPEVFVRSFPLESGGKWQISFEGGRRPRWREDGKELFYLTLDKQLMAAEVHTDETFQAGTPHLLFQTDAGPDTVNHWDLKQYYPVDNGQKFLINSTIADNTPKQMFVLLNWKSLLKKP